MKPIPRTFAESDAASTGEKTPGYAAARVLGKQLSFKRKLMAALSNEHANLSILTENGKVNMGAWFEFLDYLLIGLLDDYGMDIKLSFPPPDISAKDTTINPIANLLQGILQQYSKNRKKHPYIQQGGELTSIPVVGSDEKIFPIEIHQQVIGYIQCPSSFQGTVKSISELLTKEAKNLHVSQQSYDEKRRLIRENQKLRAKNEELRIVAYTDSLTGMPNRKYIIGFGERLMEKGKKPVIVILDIDHFKSVNDTHGHAMGDKALKLLAGKMEEFFHKAELQERIKFGRIGGEEFLLIFQGMDKNKVYTILDTFRDSIAKCSCAVNQDKSIHITISAGIETTQGKSYSQDKHGFSEALGVADAALYAAKEGGRNRVVVYEEEMPKDTLAIKVAHFRRLVNDKLSQFRSKLWK